MMDYVSVSLFYNKLGFVGIFCTFCGLFY